MQGEAEWLLGRQADGEKTLEEALAICPNLAEESDDDAAIAARKTRALIGYLLSKGVPDERARSLLRGAGTSLTRLCDRRQESALLKKIAEHYHPAILLGRLLGDLRVPDDLRGRWTEQAETRLAELPQREPWKSEAQSARGWMWYVLAEKAFASGAEDGVVLGHCEKARAGYRRALAADRGPNVELRQVSLQNDALAALATTLSGKPAEGAAALRIACHGLTKLLPQAGVEEAGIRAFWSGLEGGNGVAATATAARSAVIVRIKLIEYLLHLADFREILAEDPVPELREIEEHLRELPPQPQLHFEDAGHVTTIRHGGQKRRKPKGDERD